MPTRHSISDRLRALGRRLFSTEELEPVCSFCGADRHAGKGNIIAGPGVAICGHCAGLAASWNLTSEHRPSEGNEVDVVSVFEEAASLLPAHRGRLGAEIERVAAALSCRAIGWGYGCGLGAWGDTITVWVERSGDADAATFRQTFARMILFGEIDEGRVEAVTDPAPTGATARSPENQ
ncbi:MAG: ClpX C4-type zinc finger protein [Siculibacillus sp.]